MDNRLLCFLAGGSILALAIFWAGFGWCSSSNLSQIILLGQC